MAQVARGWRLVAAATAGLLVAACGKDGEQAQQPAGAPAPASATAPSTQPAAPTQAAAPSASAAAAVPAAAPAPAATDVAAGAPPESAVVQYAQAGLPDSLIKDGCYSCHDVNGARIGPPLRAVAGLYRNDPQAVDKLTQKVIHGGSGVWGSTPMIAHPQLSEDQVRPMIEAILKLN